MYCKIYNTEVWQRNKPTLLIICLILFAGSFLHLFFSKSEIHLLINQIHHPVADVIFKYITHLGDGLTSVIIVIVLAFISLRKSLILLAAFLSSGLLVQVLKRAFFYDAVRPAKYFMEIADLHLVEGVKLHMAHSFPSGHAASIFSLFICLSLMTRDRAVKILSLILAIIAAFSRVYLSQHFMHDVLAGAFIGTLAALAAHHLLENVNNKWIGQNVITIFKGSNP